MATVQELKRGGGRCAWRIRFYRDGQRASLSLSSKFTREEAEEVARQIDRLRLADMKGAYPDRATRAFFENASPELRKRFAAAGFISACAAYTLDDAWTEFFAEKRLEVAASTLVSWRCCWQRFFDCVDVHRQVAELTPRDALEWRASLSRVYSPGTVGLTITKLKHFWSWCVSREIVERNIFSGVRVSSPADKTRDFQVPSEWTERILDACPTQEWRVLFLLWRLGGLRRGEPFELTWDCVNWGQRRLLVRSPKTRRHAGRGERLLPLFPALERELWSHWESAPDDEPRIISQVRPETICTGFERILFVAGVPSWSKLFQNMRASAENDLIVAGYPAHVVGAWLGHTPKVQERYYLRVLDTYYDRATSGGDTSGGVSEAQKPASLTENGVSSFVSRDARSSR